MKNTKAISVRIYRLAEFGQHNDMDRWFQRQLSLDENGYFPKGMDENAVNTAILKTQKRYTGSMTVVRA